MDTAMLAATAGLLTAMVGACLAPVGADSAEDGGDGCASVVIPRHCRTPPWRPRTWAFLGVVATLALVFVGWHRPSIPVLYVGMVRAAAVAITHDPAEVNGYVSRLRPATLFLAVAYIIGIALVVRAGLIRRLAMLAHAVLYVAMSVLSHALMIAVGVTTGWLVAPFGIEATLANLLIGGLVIMRLTFSTFTLPRATAIPITRRRRLWEDALACCALIFSITLLVVAYAGISGHSILTTAWQVFLPLYAVSLLLAVMGVPLWLLWWTNQTLPQPTVWRPPVDVIVPAYNEEANIARLLGSIDIAAARYGGPVRVVVSNDGSSDHTEPIARQVIASFSCANGTVLTAPNGGQSAALNRALAITGAQVVIRIDGDCVMGPDALVYAVPWFGDPQIGMVGAMEQPRPDNVTWFHRMRAFETLFQFRFARLGQSLVDGVVVIPGTFTAFLRDPAIRVGGFTTGMNGEDTDLTMQVGRLGYRAVLDPRIQCYEDVPAGPGEFLEQRTRWARAGFHVYARHVPLRSGCAGPRVWFWTLRRGFSWFSLQVGLIAPIFMLELALTHPNYRQNVVTFALLYAAAGAVPLIISLPYAVRHGYWRSLPWIPTWFAYAFLRRLGTLEAVISLPVRPLRVPAPGWASGRARRPRQLGAG
jgi:cellulose synthase/poly-beta-1,6-N-acetylglucosamine synthase-like glycosyltransferase